jgi:hypothetical protein
LPSDKPGNRLEDIIENVQAVFRYTAGMDSRAFEEDRKTYDAVERCLERISEAVTKLGDLAPILMPGQPGKQYGLSVIPFGMNTRSMGPVRIGCLGPV